MAYDPYKVASILGFLFALAIVGVVYIYYIVLKRRNRPEAINNQELEGLRKSGTSFTLVDVRDSGEFKASPREGAVNIPLSHIPYDTVDWDRSGFYVIVCAKGIRAKKGAREMASRGFRQVRYLQP